MFSYLPLCGSRTGRADLIVCEQQILMEAQPEPGAGRKSEKRKKMKSTCLTNVLGSRHCSLIWTTGTSTSTNLLFTSY